MHVHLYVNRINFQGKAYKDSFIGKRSQQAAERVARQMGLTTVREVQQQKLDKVKDIRGEIKRLHEKVITEMRPKDFDQYIKYMKQNDVEVIPSINKQNRLQGFRFAYNGQNLKGSEVHRSMSMGRIAERIGFDKSAAQKMAKVNTLSILGKTVGLSPNLAATIAKKTIKMAVKKSIGLGMQIQYHGKIGWNSGTANGRDQWFRNLGRAEFENGILVAQLATSSDLKKINREVLESVKFRFVEKRFFTKKSNTEDEFNIAEEKEVQKLYPSEQELLEEILSNKNVRHFRQLRYLADNHARSILKLRFILHPFSFVFLLSGNHQFHVVLETLDTEEATYVWHFDKNNSSLKENLASVDSALNTIRNQGRQAYLESQLVNFSRIIHDYSDDRKGFIQWRDLLEEKFY